MAQVIYMVTNMIVAVKAGKARSADPLTVTTGLGAMFRGLEVAVFGSATLRGEMGKSYVSFPDPDVPERQAAVRFHQESLPDYRAAWRGSRPHVEVRLLFEGELLAVPGGTDYTRPAARERVAPPEPLRRLPKSG